MQLLRPPAATRASILLGWTVGLVSFVYLLALPPTLNIADESFTLYGAKRVYQGQALYHDFFDFLTPGSFYIYAAAYAVGGVSVTSARVMSSLLNAITALCVYFLALRVASAAEAVIAGLLVAVICIPVWNMASHGWIATSYGLASAAVLLAPRWRDWSRVRPAIAGMIAGLLVCTHQSRGAWLILWLVLTIPLLAMARDSGDRWRRCVRELAWTAVGGAIVCFPIVGYAIWRASLAEMLYATHTWVLENYRSYNVGKFGWATYADLWAGGLKYSSLRLLQLVPKLLALEAVTLLVAVWRYGFATQVERLAVLLLALSAVGSIAYFPDIVHVAFALPYVLVVIAGMVYRARTVLVGVDRPAGRVAMRVAFAALLAVVLVKGATNARLAWAENPLLFDTAYGTLAANSLQAETVRDLRERLRPTVAAPARLFSYPTDAWLYLALPADNPTPFALLRPVYNTPAQFQQAIAHLERDPEALVLLNTLWVKADDPFVAYLAKEWREVAGIGPPVILGQPIYRLYERVERADDTTSSSR